MARVEFHRHDRSGCFLEDGEIIHESRGNRQSPPCRSLEIGAGHDSNDQCNEGEEEGHVRNSRFPMQPRPAHGACRDRFSLWLPVRKHGA